MKNLSDLQPFPRLTLPWRYHGSPWEGLRTGYTYGLHLFTEGTGVVIIDERKYKVEKHTLVFVKPGQVYSFHYTPDTILESYSIHCDLWIRPKEMSPCFAFYPERPERSLMTKVEDCPELDKLPMISSLKSFPHLTDHFIQIVKSNDSTFYSKEISSSLLYSFILRWYNSLFAGEPRDYRIIRLMEEMERNPQEDQGYEYWCKKCGLSKSQFYKLFKKETGLTPKEYLLKTKMKKATILLQESSLTISSIAEQLGYSSIHYFSRQFADYFGMPPSEFRLKNQQVWSDNR